MVGCRPGSRSADPISHPMSQFTSSGALDPIEPLTEDEMCTMPLSIHADSDDWPAPVEALARAVRERVFDAFGVTLVPEPVTVGIAW